MQKQRVDPAAAARWLAERLKKDSVERPQGQSRGPIVKGPRAYVACGPCTRMFGSPTSQVGVPKQRARRHAADHKLGLIRKPTEVAT